MTFTRKLRGAGGTLVATYTCPEHGEFDAEVQRDENGEAPDAVPCPIVPGCFSDIDQKKYAVPTCGSPATWTPSPSIACRVRRVEVVRGKWERPERPTYLDTRKLGEGQSMEEFQAERKKVWEEKRKADVMALKRGLG